jgi:hypothetical protein
MGKRAVVAVLLVGCGGSSGDRADATATDDGNSKQPVTMHVERVSGPIAGIHVAITDANGEVVSSLVTDDQGNAAGVVPDGGAITGFTSQSNALFADGYFDPPPGSTIKLYDGDFPPPTPPVATTFHVTLTSIPANTSRLYLSYPCGSGLLQSPFSGTVDIMSTNCPATEYKLVAIALDSTYGLNGHTAVTTFAMDPGNAVSIDLPAFTYTGNLYVDEIVDSIPFQQTLTTMGSLSVRPRYVPNHSPPVNPNESQSFTFGAVQMASTQVQLPPADFYLTELNIEYTDGAHNTQYISQSSIAPTLDAENHHDASALAFVSLNAPDVTTKERAKLSWVASSAPRGMGGYVQAIWHNGLFSGTSTYRIPPDQRNTFQIPAVPAEIAATYTFGTLDGIRIYYFDTVDGATTYGYPQMLDEAGPFKQLDETATGHQFYTMTEYAF